MSGFQKWKNVFLVTGEEWVKELKVAAARFGKEKGKVVD